MNRVSETETILFDPNLRRSEKTKERLMRAGERKGTVANVVRDGVAPTPVMVKSCTYCKKPCPVTNKGFVCIHCVVIFN